MSPVELAPALRWALQGILLLLALAMALSLYRVYRGPSASDRIVALDLMGIVTVGIIAVYCALTREPQLLRVAMGVALLSFLGTVTVARYLERRAPYEGGTPRRLGGRDP